MAEDAKREAALRRLLDLAELNDESSGATAGERENAEAAARRLIRRWSFTAEEVLAAAEAEAERRLPEAVRMARAARRRQPPVPAGNQWGPFGSPTQTTYGAGTTGNQGGVFVHIVFG